MTTRSRLAVLALFGTLPACHWDLGDVWELLGDLLHDHGGHHHGGGGGGADDSGMTDDSGIDTGATDDSGTIDTGFDTGRDTGFDTGGVDTGFDTGPIDTGIYDTGIFK